MKKKQTKTPEQLEAEKRKISFQERMPIVQIRNRLYLTKTGDYYPIFSIGTKSIDLLSEDEKFEISRVLEITFETLGLEKYQFLMLPIPFDLAPYQRFQEQRFLNMKKEKSSIDSEIERLRYEINKPKQNNANSFFVLDDEDNNLSSKLEFREQQALQNSLCQKYIHDQTNFVAANLQSGRISSKHSYLVCKIKDSKNPTAVNEACKQIEEAISSAIDGSYRCSEQEMEKVLIELYNPLRPEIYINN